MKIIRNLSLLFIFFTFLALPVQKAEAVIPFEISIPETAGKVTNWIQDKVAFVQQKIKIVTESKVGKFIGSGIKNIKKGVDWVKNKVGEAMEWSANTKDLIVNSKEYQIVMLTRAITEDAIRLSHLEEEREYKVKQLVEDAQLRLELLEEKIKIAREDLAIMKADHERINEPKEVTEQRAAELEAEIQRVKAELEGYKRQLEEENAASSQAVVSTSSTTATGRPSSNTPPRRMSTEDLIRRTEEQLAELERAYADIMQELEDKMIIRESYGATYEVDYNKSYERQDLYNATREEERQLMLQIEQLELQRAQFIPFKLPVLTLGFETAKLDLPTIEEIMRLDSQYTRDIEETLKRHKANIEKVSALKWAWQHKEEEKTPLEIVSQAQEKYAADINTADTIEASLKRQENIKEDITAATISGINTANQYIAAFNDPKNDATINLGLSSATEGKSEDLYPAIQNTVIQIDLIRYIVQMEIEDLETEVLEVIMHNVNRKIARRFNEDGALVVDVCNYDIGREDRMKAKAKEKVKSIFGGSSDSSDGKGASNDTAENNETNNESKNEDKGTINVINF